MHDPHTLLKLLKIKHSILYTYNEDNEFMWPVTTKSLTQEGIEIDLTSISTTIIITLIPNTDE